MRDVLISIQEREYMMDLIVLPGLSIDVILGMKWMSDHGVLIDTSTHIIMLREPKGGNVFLVPLSLLGSSLVVTPILGCNMTILVAI